MDLRGVRRQACGQSAGTVPVVVKPADLLAQHGVEAQAAQPAGQQLAGLGEGVALQARGVIKIHNSIAVVFDNRTAPLQEGEGYCRRTCSIWVKKDTTPTMTKNRQMPLISFFWATGSVRAKVCTNRRNIQNASL